MVIFSTLATVHSNCTLAEQLRANERKLPGGTAGDRLQFSLYGIFGYSLLHTSCAEQTVATILLLTRQTGQRGFCS